MFSRGSTASKAKQEVRSRGADVGASVSSLAADAGARTVVVAGRAADVASGAAVAAKDAAIAAAPVVRSAASSAADTLSTAAGRASEVLAETAHRLADQGGDQAEKATKVGRRQARKLAKQGKRQAKSATSTGRSRLADALEASASSVRPAKQHHRIRKLLIVSGLGSAIYAVVKFDLVGKVRGMLSGGGSPEDDDPEAITLPVTPPLGSDLDTSSSAHDEVAAAVTAGADGESVHGVPARSGESNSSTEG